MLQVKTAQEIHQTLINNKIIGSTGQINFQLNGISFPVSSKDGIGGLIQEWLGHWASQNGIYLRGNIETQEFPDYYLTEFNGANYLEVKTFNFNATPAFDIANFESYIDSLLLNPSKIDTDYLIFGYELDSNGTLYIRDIWLKKIWELTTYSDKWAIKVQDKRGSIYNIRPYNFKGRSKTPPFQNKLEFLNALQNVLNSYEKTKNTHKNWLDQYKLIAQQQGVQLQ